MASFKYIIVFSLVMMMLAYTYAKPSREESTTRPGESTTKAPGGSGGLGAYAESTTKMSGDNGGLGESTTKASGGSRGFDAYAESTTKVSGDNGESTSKMPSARHG
ncbi:PREDICTED: uncharacterized protein LOC105455004 [Wasmannia auropunctata]|uniref:uncharacterized protein LOC105455004 n=1 Tax=Wasmannia auropunctata TaxID=64793 RepID=UPI0005F0883C|nr:PREDICTED: uncharacterized protein LOC105455004 [Wasmannia auropunctata]